MNASTGTEAAPDFERAAATSRVGVVGCGSIGARYVGWLADTGLEIAACDTDANRLDQLEGHSSIERFICIEDLIDWGPNRVLVATPPPTHARAACAALRAGADVLIEKPIAHDTFAAREILETAQDCDRNVYVVCNMRFHPGVAALRRALPRVGRPLFARAHFGHLLSQMRPPGLGAYASRQAQGGGVVFDCIHEFDYLRWLLGPLRYVHADRAQIGPDQIDGDDYAEILLQTRTGIRVSVHLDFLMRGKRRGAEIHGTEGSLVWQSEGKAPELCEVWFAGPSGRESLVSCDSVDPALPYRRMLNAFLGNASELQTGREGLSALDMAIAVLS